MKKIINIFIIACSFILYTCTSKDNASKVNLPKEISGYWKSEGRAFIKAVHIIKNGSLYNAELIHAANGQIINKNNLTLSTNRLDTGYGVLEYITGNDILLDKFFENPSQFNRITKEHFDEIKGNANTKR